jgi:hypothetical protein
VGQYDSVTIGLKTDVNGAESQYFSFLLQFGLEVLLARGVPHQEMLPPQHNLAAFRSPYAVLLTYVKQLDGVEPKIGEHRELLGLFCGLLGTGFLCPPSHDRTLIVAVDDVLEETEGVLVVAEGLRVAQQGDWPDGLVFVLAEGFDATEVDRMIVFLYTFLAEVLRNKLVLISDVLDLRIVLLRLIFFINDISYFHNQFLSIFLVMTDWLGLVCWVVFYFVYYCAVVF